MRRDRAADPARRRARRPRRPGPAERRQRLRPAGARRPARGRLVGARARGAGLAGRGRTPPRSRRWPRRGRALPDGAAAAGRRAGGLGRAATCWSRQAGRVRLVVLVHMPLGDRRARGARRPPAPCSPRAGGPAACSSSATRLRPERVHVAEPGVDPAGLAPGHAVGRRHALRRGGHPAKGHDVLLSALAQVPGPAVAVHACVGSLAHDPTYVARLRRQVERDGLADRVAFGGPLHGDRAGRGVRGGRPAGAADPAGELRDGGHRGAGPRPARGRHHGRRACPRRWAGCPTGAGPGCSCRPTTPASLAVALRLWLSDESLRVASCAEPPGTVARCWPAGRRPPGRWPACWREVAA